MKTKNNEQFGTFFDKWKGEPEYEKDYNKELQEFALSELLLAMMADESKSVRGLAELAGLSPATIQNLRSGKKKDLKLSNFLSIIMSCGFEVELVKGEKRIPLHLT
jgi:DNA-binding Xre family transcriptional regulator